MYGGIIPVLAGSVSPHAGVKREAFSIYAMTFGIANAGQHWIWSLLILDWRFLPFPSCVLVFSFPISERVLLVLFACLYLLMLCFSSVAIFLQMWSNSL
jgi:hypothetical protein